MDIKYELLSRPGVSNSIKKMSAVGLRSRQYKDAFRKLVDLPIKVLLNSNKAKKIGNDLYVYKVNLQDRIIFQEYNDKRVVIITGNIHDIIKVTKKK